MAPPCGVAAARSEELVVHGGREIDFRDLVMTDPAPQDLLGHRPARRADVRLDRTGAWSSLCTRHRSCVRIDAFGRVASPADSGRPN
jgi:hypothetical protein